MIKTRPLPVRPQTVAKSTTAATDCFPLPKPPITVKPKPPIGIHPLPPIDWGKVFGNLTLKDRLSAGNLHQTLGARMNSVAGKVAEMLAPNATLKPGADGVMRGPEGQPLVTVKLDGGRTAYVDPNTNQYYLPNDNIMYFRKPDTVQAKGPMPLPEGAQFSTSAYYTANEVKQLDRLANRPPLWKLALADSGFER